METYSGLYYWCIHRQTRGILPFLFAPFLQLKKYFKEISVPVDVKYIDPTYMIRACRANASDGILCTVLGQNAVSPSSLSPEYKINNCLFFFYLQWLFCYYRSFFSPFLGRREIN